MPISDKMAAPTCMEKGLTKPARVGTTERLLPSLIHVTSNVTNGTGEYDLNAGMMGVSTLHHAC